MFDLKIELSCSEKKYNRMDKCVGCSHKENTPKKPVIKWIPHPNKVKAYINIYVCKFCDCVYMYDDDPDCKMCGKEHCVYLYQVPDDERACVNAVHQKYKQFGKFPLYTWGDNIGKVLCPQHLKQF